VLFLIVMFLISIAHADQPRSTVARVLADTRSVVTAVEAYKIDFGVYPSPEGNEYLPKSITTPTSYLSELPTDPYKAFRYSRINYLLFAVIIIILCAFVLYCIYAFRKLKPKSNRNEVILKLVVISLFVVFLIYSTGILSYRDLYSSRKIFPYSVKYEDHPVPTYNYGTDEKNIFIIQSPGPDHDRDILNLTRFIQENNGKRNLKEVFLPYSYDSSNGTISNGDIFRITD